MKKISLQQHFYFIKKNQNSHNNSIYIAGIRKHSQYVNKIKKRQKRSPDEILLFNLKTKKKKFINTFYKKIKFKESNLNITLNGDFGIEKDFDEFVSKAALFIDSNAKGFLFNLKNATRIWPSAVTLLCSFKQWTEIKSKQANLPLIYSIDPSDEYVNYYLLHCGFYEYVNAANIESLPAKNQFYEEKETVKIKREKDLSESYNREVEIFSVIKNFSTLNTDQLEYFYSVILSEAVSNVTEHGHSFRDEGWWSLTQYHKTNGFISLCIADNGIGIKNSLLTGPQKDEIEKKIKSDADGEFIELALVENISGAIRASVKEKEFIFLDKHKRGARRGNGLKRIKEACKFCGITFNILSQKGYLSIDPHGILVKSGTHKTKVFAGTLLNFIIPAKKQIQNETL